MLAQDDPRALTPDRLVHLPCDDGARWRKLMELVGIKFTVKSSSEVVRLICRLRGFRNYNTMKPDLAWDDRDIGGLSVFLNEYCSEAECAQFLSRTIPFLLRELCTMRDRVPMRYNGGFRIFRQQDDGEVNLEGAQVTCLLAAGLLCTYPDSLPLSFHPTFWQDKEVPQPADVASLNFDRFYAVFNERRQDVVRRQVAKFRCILRYIEVQLGSPRRFPPSLKLIRHVVRSPELVEISDLVDDERKLCYLIVDEKMLTGNEHESLEVVRAKKYIGNDVLENGHQQDEIRFCMSPPLLVAMAMMEPVADNEVVILEGAEKFSLYSEENEQALYRPYTDLMKMMKSNPKDPRPAVMALGMVSSDDSALLCERVKRETLRSLAAFQITSADKIHSQRFTATAGIESAMPSEGVVETQQEEGWLRKDGVSATVAAFSKSKSNATSDSNGVDDFAAQLAQLCIQDVVKATQPLHLMQEQTDKTVEEVTEFYTDPKRCEELAAALAAQAQRELDDGGQTRIRPAQVAQIICQHMTLRGKLHPTSKSAADNLSHSIALACVKAAGHDESDIFVLDELRMKLKFFLAVSLPRPAACKCRPVVLSVSKDEEDGSGRLFTILTQWLVASFNGRPYLHLSMCGHRKLEQLRSFSERLTVASTTIGMLARAFRDNVGLAGSQAVETCDEDLLHKLLEALALKPHHV